MARGRRHCRSNIPAKRASPAGIRGIHTRLAGAHTAMSCGNRTIRIIINKLESPENRVYTLLKGYNL